MKNIWNRQPVGDLKMILVIKSRELGFDERNFWDASVDEIGSYVGPSITTQNKLKPTTINHIY